MAGSLLRFLLPLDTFECPRLIYCYHYQSYSTLGWTVETLKPGYLVARTLVLLHWELSPLQSRLW